ncbi:MAG: hypothetical protein M1833_001877 [Piccolia ochrophora]|nr:MAG: hypothetical protein M1833_001877 [Piccolia ochrophora]
MSTMTDVTGTEDPTTPYNIHVSSRYLDLTRKKLELTRLPREILLPTGRAWAYGSPKAEFEPLFNQWLDHYDWRARENHLNATFPQFRTLLPSDHDPPSLRIHFVHKRSTSKTALPLLYCHSWPGGFAETCKIIDPLTNPGDEGEQAFHLVVPSLPGCGFSDASESEEMSLEHIAALFDKLMARLGYAKYVAHGSGQWGFSLIRLLATHHPHSCIATHTTTPLPPLDPPSLTARPLAYLKYRLARLTRARYPLLRFGYHPSEFLAPPRSARARRTHQPFGILPPAPHTLAFALCDSPAGLLAFILAALHSQTATQGEPPAVPPTETLDLTMLAWLPGPEAALRMLFPPSLPVDAGTDISKSRTPNAALKRDWSNVPLGVSVFPALTEESPSTPVAWTGLTQRLAWVRRHEGRRAGWPVWERPADVVEDLRAFVSEVVHVENVRTHESIGDDVV